MEDAISPDLTTGNSWVTGKDSGFQGLSVIVPAWNEADRIGATLECYSSEMARLGSPFEILVILDGSTDRTKDVAEAFQDRGVRLINFPKRLGKGGAIREGFRAARYEWVGFVDADGSIPPGEAFKLASKLRDFDCAIGSRWLRDSNVVRRQSISRRLFSRLWNLSVRTLLGLRISDTQCGAKFFRRAKILPVLPQAVVTNWAFDVDLLFHLYKQGGRITEVPVTWSNNEDSRLKVFPAAPGMLAALVGIRVMSRPIGRLVPKTIVLRAKQILSSN